MLTIEFKLTEQKNEILLRIGQQTEYIDLYYYCLDNTFINDDDSLSKGILNIIAMFSNWKVKINNLKFGKEDFLPFDFSDEYIGFIHTKQVDDNHLFIQFASTNQYIGAGNNPSQLYLLNYLSKPFRLSGEEHLVTKEELIQDIESGISQFFEKLYRDGSVTPHWMY